ncbi:MAG TPA: beta-1,6-N-acetylglucosaminyltransferase [Acidothermaceae bacterium]|jgi:hypothetical protein
MNVTYLVLAHQKPNHFKALTDALAADGAEIFAHVDAKVDQAPFESPAVRFVRDRVTVFHCGWSIVDATLRLLDLAAQSIDPEGFVVFLSGDTYPLQSQLGIREFLATQGTIAQFMNIVPFPSSVADKPLSRVSRFYFEYDRRSSDRNLVPRVANALRIPRGYKAAMGNRQMFCGSQWWALRGSTILWVNDEARRESAFKRFCEHVLIPDEFFFQTLLGDSPVLPSVKRSLIYADWGDPADRPSIIGDSHMRLLSKPGGLLAPGGAYPAGTVLFARKFPDDSRSIIDRIESEVWTNSALDASNLSGAETVHFSRG